MSAFVVDKGLREEVTTKFPKIYICLLVGSLKRQEIKIKGVDKCGDKWDTWKRAVTLSRTFPALCHTVLSFVCHFLGFWKESQVTSII